MLCKSPALEHAAMVAVTIAALACAVGAQSADTRQLDAYRQAVMLAPGAARTASLERFVAASPTSSLKRDALQFLTWEYLRAGNWSNASRAAGELLVANPEDALALSVSAEQMRERVAATKKSDALLATANRGLSALDRLRKPEGMSDPEFAELKRYAYGLLTASAGSAFVQKGEFASAREYLRRAAEQLPDDSQTAYDLGLADLNGSQPNRPEGYWYLARAVNLSGNTPRSREIFEYGRKRYRDDGGSEAAWNQFVVATASRAAARASAAAARAAGSGSTATAVTTGAGGAPASSRRGTAVATSPTETENAPPVHKPVARAGEPLSLGILIETAMTSKENRGAMFRSLNEIVRALGPNDEAFVLSFSHDLVFEEDLTGDYRRLQQAIDRIQPESGTALMDAVGFAAGHLQRIAKNPNRVLLVISDGRNTSSRANPLEVSSEIRSSEVRIYCIGMGIDSGEEMNRLQALASGTGGQAAFISGPRQFDMAARQIARNMGIVPSS